MEGAFTTDPAAEPSHEAWAARELRPLEADLEPLTPRELYEWFRGGEPEADACERILAFSARARGGVDVAIAEGLYALRQGDRLAALASHLDDYAREVLDLEKRTAQKLAALGGALRMRPLLREALRAGRVRLRAAETVLPVAFGEAEARWVKRASVQTVRELEEAVRRTRLSPEDEEEDWLRLRAHLPLQERTVVDEALDLAGRSSPGRAGSSGWRRSPRSYWAGSRARMRTTPARSGRTSGHLRFDDGATAEEIDRRLRTLARLRAGWDALTT